MDMQAEDDQIKTSLDGEVQPANDVDSELIRSLISVESLKRQLQLRSEDIQEVEDLKYRLDGAEIKKHQA